MQVNSISQNINSVNNRKYKAGSTKQQPQNQNSKAKNGVAFTGTLKSPNAIVGLMDFIVAGGYAASFCIQDGLGFVAPRVGKGLLRGGKKKHDENGNEILDKNGEPKRELNWAYARKEGIREIITGPSAFVIPWILLKGINKKFGRGNSVRLDYIDGFQKPFSEFAQNNIDAIKAKSANKQEFYKDVFKDVLQKSINDQNGATPIKDIDAVAEDLARKQINTEEITNNKDLKGRKNKAAREQAFKEKVGTSVEDTYMVLRKKHVGGVANDMEIAITASDGKTLKHGSIGELTTAMGNYFDDAVKNVHNALKDAKNTDIKEVLKHFTNKRMGSRLLTNFGLFATVALFYTQIPKLYNMGTHGKNPALMNDEAEQQPALAKNNDTKTADKNKKNVSFSGRASFLEKIGDRVFNSKKMKSVSDIYELNGPVIQGNAMATLLYGACIPPRLANAQDKYDYGEILVRDMTAFTALLFGAKALARIFSDGFTKLTGLALNNKDLEGRNFFQKAWDYLNPADKRHSILSSKQLDYKYTDIENYKGGINGFVEFIEKSGGNIKKAISNDSKLVEIVDDIVKDNNKGKTFAQSSAEEIKAALAEEAKKAKSAKLDKVYEYFKTPNKLLNRAKTCNSLFGALSTLVLVPGLIIALTDICKAMTEKRQAKEKAINNTTQAQQSPLVPSNKPTMAGFLNKTVA